MSAEKRVRAGRAGGNARAELPAAELSRINSAGGKAINSPVGLAKRLVKKWPELGEEEQAEVLAVLLDGLPVQRARTRRRAPSP